MRNGGRAAFPAAQQVACIVLRDHVVWVSHGSGRGMCFNARSKSKPLACTLKSLSGSDLHALRGKTGI